MWLISFLVFFLLFIYVTRSTNQKQVHVDFKIENTLCKL